MNQTQQLPISVSKPFWRKDNPLAYIVVILPIIIITTAIILALYFTGNLIKKKNPNTLAPTRAPTLAPTILPTLSPTLAPILLPTTGAPTLLPTTGAPTFAPTFAPTMLPTTGALTLSPTMLPTTGAPTLSPTMLPTTGAPTLLPTTGAPTEAPNILDQIHSICSLENTCNFGSCGYGNDAVWLDNDYLYMYGTIYTNATNMNPGFAAIQNSSFQKKWTLNAYLYKLVFTMYDDSNNKLYEHVASESYQNTAGNVAVLVYNNKLYIRTNGVDEEFDLSGTGMGFSSTLEFNNWPQIRTQSVGSMYMCKAYCCNTVPPSSL